MHLFTLNAAQTLFSSGVGTADRFPVSVCGANVGMAERTRLKIWTLPAILAVTVDTDEREIGDDEAYVTKNTEYG
jgi:hypothetical protein